MNIKLRPIFIFLILSYFSISSLNLLAQEDNPQFENVSSAHKLFHFSINSILQDRTGFLWFGTRTGLNLYDGKRFTVFKAIDGDSSISNDLIRVIYEAGDGTLWIGTENGLNRYNRERKTFRKYFYDKNDKYSIADNKVTSITEDRNGNIWLATIGGLSMYDKKIDRFINYYSKPNNEKTIQANEIWSVYINHKGDLLVGYMGQKLDYIILSNGVPDPDNLDVKHYSCSAVKDASVYISKIFQDKNGNYWFGTFGSGLFYSQRNEIEFENQINKTGGAFSKTKPFLLNKYSKPISNNFITDIIQDSHLNIWIGTFGGGLNRLNYNGNVLSTYSYNNKDQKSISSNYVRSLLVDKSRNLWIGTYTGGLNKYSPDKNKFSIYQANRDDKGSIKNNLITSIFQDKEGILWIGTREGLNMLDRKKGIAENYIYGSKNMINAPCNLVRSICEDNSGKLWLGTHDGLNCFSKKDKKFIASFNKQLQDALKKTTIRALLFDDNNILWIGAMSGLYRYDLSANNYRRLSNIQGDSSSLSYNYIWSLYKDKNNNLWAGTREGLNKLDAKEGSFKRYYYKIGDKYFLEENFFTSITSDNNGNIWIGTYSKGLHRLTPDYSSGRPDYSSSSISAYNINGKNDISIGGLIVDKSQNLWIGSDDGILVLDIKQRNFRLFDISEYLVSNELNTGSYFSGINNEFFFGGNNGVISFFPNNMKYNDIVPNIVITSFKKFNTEVYSGTAAANLKELNLSYKDNNFSFSFAALDYSNPSLNQYKYKMEGYDEDWIDCGNKNEAVYMNLPAGEYIFRVKGSNNDKVWNETGVSVKIIINPPFWDTLWFRILFVLVIFGIVYSYFQLRYLRLERQRKKLERLVTIRTYDLKETNIKLEMEISERKKAEEAIIKTNALLSESNSAKDKLFSIISHDLRGSIGTFMSMLKLLVEQPEIVGEQELREILKNMEESAESTYYLLDNLLNWAKSQRGAISVKPELQEINSVVMEVIFSLGHIAKSKNIVLSSALTEVHTAVFDKNTITTVIRNLTSNALKFTKPNGKVWISAVNEDNGVIISVNDDGIGIPKNNLDKIFNAYQGVTTLGTNGEKGTGLGLMLCKEFVEKNSGRIWVESEEGKGSSFRFSLLLVNNRS